MPLRAYRCSRGHEFEVVESMDGPRTTRCPELVDERRTMDDQVDNHVVCGDRDLTPIIQPQQRPIVKGGTPRHHQRMPEGS